MLSRKVSACGDWDHEMRAMGMLTVLVKVVEGLFILGLFGLGFWGWFRARELLLLLLLLERELLLLLLLFRLERLLLERELLLLLRCFDIMNVLV